MYSLNAYCEVVAGFKAMSDKVLVESKFRKEEVKNRMSNDEVDRKKLQSKTKLSINVFDSGQHPENGLVNFATGKTIVNLTVTVEEISAIGQQQLSVFEANVPLG